MKLQNICEAKYAGGTFSIYDVYKKYRDFATQLAYNNYNPVSDAVVRTKHFDTMIAGQLTEVTGVSMDIVMKHDIKRDHSLSYIREVLKDSGLPYTRIRQYEASNDRYFEVAYIPDK